MFAIFLKPTPVQPGRMLLFFSALLIINLGCFWPVVHLGFNIYDDWDYVYQNPNVKSGLNLKNFIWAFTSAHSSNWHPLTWLSHMLDCQLFGLNPAEQHLINLGFQVANTGLLFWAMLCLSSAQWRSFLVAALFASHPLHVQSVAWISERKDVLSGFFALLMLLAYARYCRHKSISNYVLVLVLFALGLMSKPMLVTLPAILLLLDYWPLKRMGIDVQGSDQSKPKLCRQLLRWRPFLIEKIPLVLLGIASGMVTIWAQDSGGSIISLTQLPWQDRCLHAVISYSQYLEKLFWPANLAVFYPATTLAAGVIAIMVIIPVILSAGCLWRRQTQPYLVVGWLWFVITLIPVIGLLQVGMQSIADRYMYLPSIGIFILVAWNLAEIAAKSTIWRNCMIGAAIFLVVACGIDTRHQLGYWRNNVTLFKHVVEVTPENNFPGYFFLGASYGEINDLDNAASCFSTALDLFPGFKEARAKLGFVRLLQKNYQDAERQFRELLKVQPANFNAHKSLAMALAGQQKFMEAQAEYQVAQNLNPNDQNLLQLLSSNSQKIRAEHTLPSLTGQLGTNNTPEIQVQIAIAKSILGKYRAAAEHYQKALEMAPQSLDAANNLAWLLATSPDASFRDGHRAIKLAKNACDQSQSQVTVFLGTLAAAYAEASRFDDAIAMAQKACTNATALGETELLKRNQELLELYQQHKPYHEVAEDFAPSAP